MQKCKPILGRDIGLCVFVSNLSEIIKIEIVLHMLNLHQLPNACNKKTPPR